jgi:hypothetical protein
VQCKAKTQAGPQCRARAIAGTTVCRVHGGSAPQVIQAARRRLLLAADPIAARLIQIALGKKTEPKDAIVAIREILNRAGVHAEQSPDDGSIPGQVLWDEFIQIHRRRAGHAADE